jgi:ABC-type transporter Mla subunit MlaD
VSLLAGQERRAEKVGAVVLVVLVAAVGFVMFLAGRIHLGRTVRIQVLFHNVGSLHEGAQIIVAGRSVGHVTAIALVPADGLPADHPLAGTGGAAAWLKIHAGETEMVPVNGEFFISSRGALAERFLEVGPPPGGAAPGRPVKDGDLVRGVDPPSLDRALQRTYDNLERARAFTDYVGPDARDLVTQIRALSATLAELDPGPGGFADAARHWSAALDQARTAWSTLDRAGVDPAHVEAMAASVARTTEAARGALRLVRARADLLSAGLDRSVGKARAAGPAVAELRQALGKVSALSAKLDDIMAKVQDLSDRIARGEGTIARLQHDPEFPEDAKALGKMIKRHPWRLFGHPQDDHRGPPPPPPRR